MKKLSFFVILLFLIISGTAFVNAQVTIGADTVPHPGAVLDLHSTTQGLLMPRVALSDVAVFGLAGTASTAVGMMVYNTNASISNGQGVGAYVWDGNSWKVSAGSSGGVLTPGVLDTIRGAKDTYRIWCFADTTHLGCWMVDNSKEGTPSYTMYANSSVYGTATGAYYSQAQANSTTSSACPPGYRIPSLAEWTSLGDYINSPRASAEEKFWWSVGTATAGLWNGAWGNLGVQGAWWASDSTVPANCFGGIFVHATSAAGFLLTVRCVHK